MASVSAMAEDARRVQEEMTQAVDEVIAGVDFSAVDELMLAMPGWPEPVSVKVFVRALANGEGIDAQAAVEAVMRSFFDALSGMGRVMLALMLPVLLMSTLSAMAMPKGGALSGLGRSVGFMLMLIPAVTLVMGELAHTKETIVALTTRMEGMLPMLLTLLTALGGNASSAFFHPVVAAASGSMVFLAKEVILRLVMCTCAVTTVNHLTDRVHLTRMAQLLRSIVCWLLGVSFTVFLGAMSMQGVCSASVDGVAIRAAKYAVDNFVPIVGGMFSDTMDTLIGCTLIVKNALGVAAMVVLVSVTLAPMMRTVAVIFMMKLSLALLEPVADGEVIAAIGDFSRIIVLFFVTMLCVAAMYFLLIVQLILVGNLTVMLR